MKSLAYFITIVFSIGSFASSKCQGQNIEKVFTPKYAKHFKISYYKDFKIIQSKNLSYLIKNRMFKLDCSFEYVVNSNPAKISLTSTTYINSLKELGLINKLVSFQGKRFIYSQEINKDKVIDLNFNLDVEDLLKTKTELVIAYEDNVSDPKKLKQFYKFNIPVVYNNDYFESSALGRAEWIIFNSAFFDKEDAAKLIFNEIEKKYLYLKQAQVGKPKLKVLIGDIQNGKWVTPGGESDFAQIVKDAGGELILDRKSSKTQDYSLEEIKSLKSKPDVWLLNNSFQSKNELSSFGYKDFLEIPVFNYVKKVDHTANDYWETAPTRPDLLLEDIINIFQKKYDKLVWYKQI